MSEYLDVLDENGKPTGEKKLRSEVHRDGDWHKEVFIFTLDTMGQVLIQLRAPHKTTHANQWDMSAAGHAVSGDDSLAAAVREFSEELGIDLARNDFKLLFTSRKRSTTERPGNINAAILDIFLVQKDINLEDVKLQKEEVSAVKYISLDDFKFLSRHDPTFVNRKFYPEIFEYLKKNENN